MSISVENELKSESLQLLREFQLNPSLELRNRLVRLNFGLVRKEAHHWVNQCTESFDDLVQVGSLGLIRAIERFDMSKGHAFSSFAVPYIRGEIQHYLRDKGAPVRIPRRWQALQHQATMVTRELQSTLKRQPTDMEIAEVLEVPLHEWQEIKLAYRNRAPLSLDAPMRDEDEASTLGDLLPDPQYRSFQLAQEDRIRLQQALVQLEQRTRDVLEFVFLYDLTQKETAERLGISAVTVSRRVKKGLKLLKKAMLGME
ncbi:RNA polymerase sigma factor SigF [Leptolyngbya sp. AN02str]|uniref:RNA polymerase sigma factor SigF n=1 Tax=Leptolyngbya sp. AN02str TaxID=3423363 RepID=UPI003D3177AD